MRELRSRQAAGRVAVWIMGFLLLVGVAVWVWSPREGAARPGVTVVSDQERLLVRGYRRLWSADPLLARQPFEQVLAQDPDSEEAVAGLVLAHLRAGQGKLALEVLDEHAAVVQDHGAFAGYRVEAQAAVGDQAEKTRAQVPAEAADALDAFLLAELAALRAQAGETQDWERYLQHVTRAVGVPASAPLLWLCERVRALLFNHEKAEAAKLAPELQRRFPGQVAAWYWAGMALMPTDNEGAEQSLLRATELAPGQDDLWEDLGYVRSLLGNEEAALAALHKALDLPPERASEHASLGRALLRFGRLDEALAEHRRAVALQPSSAAPYLALGATLQRMGKIEESLAACQKATELEPGLARAWRSYGILLVQSEQLDEAIAAQRKAVALDPRSARDLHELGDTLSLRGYQDEAMKVFLKAIELEPDNARHHLHVGILLTYKHLNPQAIAEFKRAVELDPSMAEAHAELGELYMTMGLEREARQEWRRVLDLHPKDANLPYRLANFAGGSMRPDALVLEGYRQATETNPKFAQAWCNLGQTLMKFGEFQKAADALEKGHALGSKQPNWPYPSALWLKNAREMAVLERRLKAVVSEKSQPLPAEFLVLANVAFRKSWNLAAARLFQKAFAAQPSAADDRKTQRRFHAALSAARVGRGAGPQAAGLEQEDRARWSSVARQWLLDEVEQWRSDVEAGRLQPQAVKVGLGAWRYHAELRHFRPGSDIWGDLSPDEQRGWQRLWSEVEDVLKQSSGR